MTRWTEAIRKLVLVRLIYTGWLIIAEAKPCSGSGTGVVSLLVTEEVESELNEYSCHENRLDTLTASLLSMLL